MTKKGEHVLSTMFKILVILPLCFPTMVYAQCNKSPVIFNFGDSNSDTGNLEHGKKQLPYGSTYFGKPTGRESDGRLIIDFLCRNLSTSFLTPYDEKLESNYKNGANFAISGSSILPDYSLDGFGNDTLGRQVRNFLNFKKLSLKKYSQGLKGLVDKGGFENALYIIDIGLADLVFSKLVGNLSYDQLIHRNPKLMNGVKDSIKILYGNGAKNFWIHNSAPMGCAPQQLYSSKPDAQMDEAGCLKFENDITKAFNENLRNLSEALRSELKNASIVYVDIYAIKHGVIANATQYGFENPLMACCGSGGPPYNGDLRASCGQTLVKPCKDVSKAIYWDFVHNTEAANNVFATKILSRNYTTPPTNFDFFCKT